MKSMKKIATLLLAVCLVVPCFSIVSHAANRIMFEDPTTAVGQTLALKGVIQTDSAMEDREVVMTYDTNMLKFKSGDHVTETKAGELTYKAAGAAGGQRVEFVMNFEVLQAGTTEVKVKGQSIYSTSDAKINCQEGSSVIKIEAGSVPVTADPSGEGVTVEVNGETYTFSEAFNANDIPEGFAEATLEYGGTNYKVVKQEASGLYLAYLTGSDGTGKFFLYVEENATFAPFEQIEISDTTVITLLSNVEDLAVPESYRKTEVEIKGSLFPAWQNSENTEVRVFYAINNRGEKSFYQYDDEEGTYQRFEMPKAEKEKHADTIVAKLSETLGENLNTVVLAIGFGFILLLILVIVLSVKLYNRNSELDELYDEFGMDIFDDKDSVKKDSRIVRIDDEEDVFLDSEEDTFENIEEETVDDIVIAELDEGKENPEEEEPEGAVELLSQEEEKASNEIEEMEDAIKAVAAEVEADESYWDEEETADFEMDFIDLDD